MIFISLLVLVTLAIAGSAAFFSVYGLAATFSGAFWSVIMMGASLEAGKLIAASYLYRFWKETSWFLKAYLFAGITCLMLITSVGIFGFLSQGYQSDVLPLKQKQERVQLLEQEKERILQRKRQIDDLLARAPLLQNLQNQNGEIDSQTLRALRESNRTREQLSRQYKDEQQEVTNRLKQLDKELLELRQELIKTEVKIGPITYIAKVFGLPTDDATKYLIFLIIFAFDPMAIALTLAVNIALQKHKESKEQRIHEKQLQDNSKNITMFDNTEEKQETKLFENVLQDNNKELEVIQKQEQPFTQTIDTNVVIDAADNDNVNNDQKNTIIELSTKSENKQEKAPVNFYNEKHITSLRPGSAIYPSALKTSNATIDMSAIQELIQHYKTLKENPNLTKQEQEEKKAIELILHRHNLLMYLD